MSERMPVRRAADGDQRAASARTVRPRFTVEDIRILLAAMLLYSRREKTPDVQTLYSRIDALSEEIDR